MNIKFDKYRIKHNKKHAIFFFIFCLILLINPLPLGSNRVWAWSFLGIMASILLLAMILCSQLSDDCLTWHRLKKMRYELRLMILWLLVHVLYLVPLPLGLLQWLSPTVGAAYATVNESYGYLSLDVYASYENLMLSLYYFAIFILGIVLINGRKKIIIILSLFLFLGVLESIYGMYLVSIGQTGTLIQVNSVTSDNASGTFINKNHLVAFLSMCFMMALALRQYFAQIHDNTTYLGFKVRILRFISQPVRLLDFSLFIIFAGIWSTHSRSGVVSFILASLCFCLLYFFNKKHRQMQLKTLLMVFVGVVLTLVFVANDISYLLDTLGRQKDNSLEHVLNSGQGRLLAVQQAIEHYPKYWFSGVGPGAYQVFFVNHRLLEQTAYFDHAHNDYVEFIIECGVFSVIIFLLLAAIIYRVVSFVLCSNSRLFQLVAISSISCVVYMMIHGSMDFNARIPANVVTIIIAISVIYGKIIMSGMNKIKK